VELLPRPSPFVGRLTIVALCLESGFVARELRYLDIADALRGRLAAGDYAGGRPLPSESELAAEHGVSRVTIRKALGELKGEGLIDSRQGFGWYPVGPVLRQTLSQLTTIDGQIRAGGRTPRRQVIEFSFCSPPTRIARILHSDQVLEILRVSFADDEPFARVRIWVPGDLGAELSRRAVEEHPLYELLPVSLAGATQSISAISASSEDAALLRVPPGSPLLRCRRTTSDREGRVVLTTESAFNPLTTEFVADLPVTSDSEASGLRLVPPPDVG
jgi:GntR family transcriptional regulator